MKLRTLERDGARYVCRNLRHESAREVFAAYGDIARDHLAERLFHETGPHSFVFSEERDIYIGGAIPVSADTYQFWGLATPEFHKIVRPLTKWIRRVLIPDLVKMGAKRLNSYMLDGQPKVAGWLKLLGGEQESALQINGASFVSFCWKFD